MSQNLAFLIMDTETGGVDRNKDGICQTVAIYYEPHTKFRQILMNARSKPRRTMAQGAINVHGVTNEMCNFSPMDKIVQVQLKLLVNEMLRECAADGTQLIFAGYNSEKFDMPFMDNVLGEEFFTKFPHFDLMRVARKMWPNLPKHKLVNVWMHVMGTDKVPDDAHDAAFDCLMCADIFDHLNDTHQPDWLAWADDLSAPMVVSVMPHGEHKGKPFSQVPQQYLEFVVREFDTKDDARHSAVLELKRRGVLQ